MWGNVNVVSELNAEKSSEYKTFFFLVNKPSVR